MTARLAIDRERLAELCRRWGVAELALFGSALRDDFRADEPCASDHDDLHLFLPVRIGWDWRAAASRQAAVLTLAALFVTKASRSGFTTSACVVHMPCGSFS